MALESRERQSNILTTRPFLESCLPFSEAFYAVQLGCRIQHLPSGMQMRQPDVSRFYQPDLKMRTFDRHVTDFMLEANEQFPKYDYLLGKYPEANLRHPYLTYSGALLDLISMLDPKKVEYDVAVENVHRVVQTMTTLRTLQSLPDVNYQRLLGKMIGTSVFQAFFEGDVQMNIVAALRFKDAFLEESTIESKRNFLKGYDKIARRWMRREDPINPEIPIPTEEIDDLENEIYDSALEERRITLALNHRN